MKEIVGSTVEETKLIKAIQRKMGILDNGIVGTDTMSSIAIKLGADAFPLAVKMYGCPTVIAKSVLPFCPSVPSNGIAQYAYTILGSFTEPRATSPCSILIANGKVVHSYSCHAWKGQPESVLFQLKDGTLGIKRCTYTNELPEGVVWAVGGMGLLGNFNPTLEGFTGANADVMRRCGHTVLGYKNGFVYGICFGNHTTDQIQTILRNKFMLDGAIQLDGGGLYQYNLKDMTYKPSMKCGYAIQFVGG